MDITRADEIADKILDEAWERSEVWNEDVYSFNEGVRMGVAIVLEQLEQQSLEKSFL